MCVCVRERKCVHERDRGRERTCEIAYVCVCVLFGRHRVFGNSISRRSKHHKFSLSFFDRHNRLQAHTSILSFSHVILSLITFGSDHSAVCLANGNLTQTRKLNYVQKSGGKEGGWEKKSRKVGVKGKGARQRDRWREKGGGREKGRKRERGRESMAPVRRTRPPNHRYGGE